MKILRFTFLAYLFFTSCVKNSEKITSTPAKPEVNQLSNSKPKIALPIDKELFSVYKKTEDIFRVARAVSNGKDSFNVLLFEIDTSKPEDARQKFISSESFPAKELEHKRNELQSVYNWKPSAGDKVLFVQIQPLEFNDELQILNKAHEIDDQISKSLAKENLAEWLASDVGPGGGNILYTVSEFENSLQTILGILKENKLDKNVLIARRVYVNKQDWFYEVVYPQNYSGEFNTM